MNTGARYEEVSIPDDDSISPISRDPPDTDQLIPNRRRNRRSRRGHSEHRTFLSIVADDLAQIPTYNNTSAALVVCREKVIKPFDVFLKVVGWVPVFSSRSSASGFISFLNYLHPVLVVCLIVFGYIIQWSSCFCRFIANDGWAYKLEPLIDPPISNNSTTATPQYTYSCLDHLISRFIIINILHSIAYAYSFYTLRVAEPEQLVSLMERVFLFANSLGTGLNEEAKLITYMRRILFYSVIWILLSILTDTLHLYSQYGHIHFFFFPLTDNGNIALCVLLILSLNFLNVVYVAVVVNYTFQCRLLSFFIDGIMHRLRENTIELFSVMEKCGELLKFMRIMNNTSGVAVSIVLINFVSIVVLGVFSITKPLNKEALTVIMYVSTAFSIVLWALLITAPTVAAARLTSRCTRLRKMGLEVRLRTPLEYERQTRSLNQSPFSPPISPVPASPLEDRQMPIKIDSFVSFMSSLSLSAKLCLLPVHSGVIILIVLLGCLAVYLYVLLRPIPISVPAEDIIPF